VESNRRRCTKARQPEFLGPSLVPRLTAALSQCDLLCVCKGGNVQCSAAIAQKAIARRAGKPAKRSAAEMEAEDTPEGALAGDADDAEAAVEQLAHHLSPEKAAPKAKKPRAPRPKRAPKPRTPKPKHKFVHASPEVLEAEATVLEAVKVFSGSAEEVASLLQLKERLLQAKANYALELQAFEEKQAREAAEKAEAEATAAAEAEAADAGGQEGLEGLEGGLEGENEM